MSKWSSTHIHEIIKVYFLPFGSCFILVGTSQATCGYKTHFSTVTLHHECNSCCKDVFICRSLNVLNTGSSCNGVCRSYLLPVKTREVPIVPVCWLVGWFVFVITGCSSVTLCGMTGNWSRKNPLNVGTNPFFFFFFKWGSFSHVQIMFQWILHKMSGICRR